MFLLRFNKFSIIHSLKSGNFFLVSYLLSVTTVVLFATKPTYGVNDDVIIQNILSGSYTGKPAFIFSGPATPKILFGMIVSSLYQVIPIINWFPILMLAFVLIGWFIIGQNIIKNFNFYNFGFYVILTFIYLFWFIPSPTYTASSILLSIATFYRIFFDDHLERNQKIIYALLLSSSFLMRPESFLFGLVTVGSIYLTGLFFSRKYNFSNFLTIAIIFITVFLFNSIFEKLYIHNDKDWASYTEFEELRYRIQANDIELSLLSDPNKYNWTKAETKLYSEYLTVDKKNFNISEYEQVINKYNNQNQNTFNISNFIKVGHSKLINSDINWSWFNLAKIIPLSFALYLFLSWPNFIKFVAIYAVSSFILYFAMLYIAYYLRQPERVQVSAIFAGIIIPLLIYNSILYKQHFENSIDINLVSFLILILVITFSYNQIRYFDQKYNGMESIWTRQVKFYESFPKDSIFIGNASQFRNNWQNPYINSFYEIEKRMFSLGWHNFSPYWNQRAKKMKLDYKNLIINSISSQNVYWVFDESTAFSFKDYLNENSYKFDSLRKIKEVDLAGSKYIVWKIS